MLILYFFQFFSLTGIKKICEKCDYRCNFISQWNNHCERESHKTGKKNMDR